MSSHFSSEMALDVRKLGAVISELEREEKGREV